MMATFQLPARRLLLAGGFAVAVAAAPAFAVFAVSAAEPASSVASCPPGEEVDNFTGVCVPHTVPNTSGAFVPIPGSPNLPAVQLPGGGGIIPCTGANTGQCIGLAESQVGQPHATPDSHVGSSPTVYGHVGGH